MLEFETLTIRMDGSVLYAAFNNPPLNIVTARVAADVIALCDHVDNEHTVRVIVFSSAIPAYFLAHQDYSEPDEMFTAVLQRLVLTDAITIAQVEGRARSLGSDFALACDMTFAAREAAIFGQIDVGVGKLPRAETIEALGKGLGAKRALEVMLGCNDFCARDAERYGWINRALPSAELEPFVCALAQRLASFPRTTSKETKRRLRLLMPALGAVTSAVPASRSRDSESAERLLLVLQRGMGSPGELEQDFGRVLAELPPSPC